ncbi:Glia maturation factor beta [Entamoeba marina]
MDAIYQLSDDAFAKYKKFKIRRNPDNCALVLLIDKETNSIEVEEEYEKTPLEELQEDLPSMEPRFIVYSYRHQIEEGRVTYPLVLIYYSPTGINPQYLMIYTSSLPALQTKLSGVQKCWTVKDQEDLSEEWLLEKLSKF